MQCSDDIEKWQFVDEPGGWTKNAPNGEKKTLQDASAMGRMCVRYQVSPVAAARFILAKMRGNPKKPQLGGVLPHHNPGQAMIILPYSYQHFILGDFFVVDKSPCRFDTRMTLKEDYDLSCAHLKTHGSVVRCNHLMVFAKHETNAGGACASRDAAGERELENIRILKEKYPGVFSDNPKRPGQVVMRGKVIARKATSTGSAKQSRPTQAELKDMSTSDLKKKALALGATKEDVDVNKSKAARNLLIQFIVAAIEEEEEKKEDMDDDEDEDDDDVDDA